MLDKLTQLHKSKFFKCFLIAIVLVFSYEVSKPKAFAPLLPYILPVVGGVIVGEMAEMGFKWGTKAIVKKQSDNFAEMALNEKNIYGLDFAKTNPYRNKDGSLAIPVSTNDRAKIAGLIAGTAAGYLMGPDNDGDGVADACQEPPLSGTNLTWKQAEKRNIKEPDPEKRQWYNYAVAYIHAYYVRKDDGIGVTVYYKNKVTNEVLFSQNVGSPTGSVVKPLSAVAESVDGSRLSPTVEFTAGTTDVYTGSAAIYISPDLTYSSYTQNAQTLASQGQSADMCGGMFVPSTIDNVYPAPLNMTSSYPMPNAADIPPVTINIKNVFPPSETEGPVSWEDVQKNQPDPQQFADIVDNSVNYDIGEINNNPITIGEINNHYTDINYPIKIIDFKPDTGEIEPPSVEPPSVEPPVVTPEPDVPAIPNEDVDDLDHSMWQVMRNTYNYLDDGIDSSLAAMKGITDSASGITTYLGQTMGWLPAEWRAVFTSAFVLGVFAHFLRR